MNRREWLVSAAQFGALALAAQPAPSADPHFWTLTEAAAQIRKRKISSGELTRLLLDRIHQRDPRLNAFITLTADRALEQARAADRDQHAGKLRGPVHGVPIALKDNIDTAGILTTASAKIFLKRVPDQDAEVARRIAAAGTVMLGKLNLDEFAFAGTGTTGYFGPVHNPWNLDHITGGSSAGNAAALADGLCFASIGSDDGGSVRTPASHCSVVGFKPTYGRISTRGIVPSAYSLDCPGPMARTVEDVALLLTILAGYDPADSIVLDRPVPDYTRALRDSTAGLRIGIPRENFFDRLHPDTASSVEAAIDHMRQRVREVREVKLPRFENVPNGSTDIELYHYHQRFFDKSPEDYHPTSRRMLERAKTIQAVAYVETLKRIRECRRDVKKTFADVDLLLLPAVREPAPTIRETLDGAHRRPPSNLAAFNRYGLPSLVLPCGFSKDGLPIGLEIVGPAFGEPTVLAAAFAYQQSTDWHQRRPPA